MMELGGAVFTLEHTEIGFPFFENGLQHEVSRVPLQCKKKRLVQLMFRCSVTIKI
jgi:hypothetical protein